MLKHLFLTLFSVPLLAATPQGLKVEPSELTIKMNRDYDATAQKRIYRNLVVSGVDDDSFDIRFFGESANLLNVSLASKSCQTSTKVCDLTLEIVGPQGQSQGTLELVTSQGDSLGLKVPISANLESAYFSALPQYLLEDKKLQDELIAYPKVDILSCKDLSALDKSLVKQCKAIYGILTSESDTYSQKADVACKLFEEPIERSKCEGLVQGMRFRGCEALDVIGKKTCESFQRASVKSCQPGEYDCEVMQQMLHGYLDCAHHTHSDLVGACVAYQNAYIHGISHSWLRGAFLPYAREHKSQGATPYDNTPALSFIPSQRIDTLAISKEDLQFLINSYPTLMRSALLNFDMKSPVQYSDKAKLWGEIESHLTPSQTVGFELECPGLQYDLTSGNNPSKIGDFLQFRWISFLDLLTEKEQNRKKLTVDSRFEKANNGFFMRVLEAQGIWHKNPEWPYFNTYGMSLFKSSESFLSFPLIDATLESRYHYDHFPHVELVSAPMTQETHPLNLKNTMRYMADLIGKACNLNGSSAVQFTPIPKWSEEGRNVLTTGENQETLDYNSSKQAMFEKGGMVCRSNAMGGCHVQSNVGVFLDQLFTDTFLVQSIGHNYAYRADALYLASWNVAKKAFSVLQWDSSSDVLVDGRNHAAGIFTYMVNELYARAILYAGGFDFWKGTLAHLMKYPLREVWQTLDDDPSDGFYSEKMLFQKAALALWSSETVPSELTVLTGLIVNDFARYAVSTGNLNIPAGKLPKANAEFQEKVNGIFKELLWTVALADDATYNQATTTLWGSVISSETDVGLLDTQDGGVKRHGAFVRGCEYGSHGGAQCDIAKVIKPVYTSVHNGQDSYPRTYVVVETRYGQAPFNQAVFWRCHEDNRSRKLGHLCQ